MGDSAGKAAACRGGGNGDVDVMGKEFGGGNNGSGGANVIDRRDSVIDGIVVAGDDAGGGDVTGDGVGGDDSGGCFSRIDSLDLNRGDNPGAATTAAAIAPEATAPEAVAPEAVAPEAVAPEAVGIDATQPQPKKRTGRRGRRPDFDAPPAEIAAAGSATGGDPAQVRSSPPPPSPPSSDRTKAKTRRGGARFDRVDGRDQDGRPPPSPPPGSPSASLSVVPSPSSRPPPPSSSSRESSAASSPTHTLHKTKNRGMGMLPTRKNHQALAIKIQQQSQQQSQEKIDRRQLQTEEREEPAGRSVAFGTATVKASSPTTPSRHVSQAPQILLREQLSCGLEPSRESFFPYMPLPAGVKARDGTPGEYELLDVINRASDPGADVGGTGEEIDDGGPKPSPTPPAGDVAPPPVPAPGVDDGIDGGIDGEDDPLYRLFDRHVGALSSADVHGGHPTSATDRSSRLRAALARARERALSSRRPAPAVDGCGDDGRRRNRALPDELSRLLASCLRQTSFLRQNLLNMEDWAYDHWDARDFGAAFPVAAKQLEKTGRRHVAPPDFFRSGAEGRSPHPSSSAGAGAVVRLVPGGPLVMIDPTVAPPPEKDIAFAFFGRRHAAPAASEAAVTHGGPCRRPVVEVRVRVRLGGWKPSGKWMKERNMVPLSGRLWAPPGWDHAADRAERAFEAEAAVKAEVEAGLSVEAKVEAEDLAEVGGEDLAEATGTGTSTSDPVPSAAIATTTTTKKRRKRAPSTAEASTMADEAVSPDATDIETVPFPDHSHPHHHYHHRHRAPRRKRKFSGEGGAPRFPRTTAERRAALADDVSSDARRLESSRLALTARRAESESNRRDVLRSVLDTDVEAVGYANTIGLWKWFDAAGYLEDLDERGACEALEGCWQPELDADRSWRETSSYSSPSSSSSRRRWGSYGSGLPPLRVKVAAPSSSSDGVDVTKGGGGNEKKKGKRAKKSSTENAEERTEEQSAISSAVPVSPNPLYDRLQSLLVEVDGSDDDDDEEREGEGGDENCDNFVDSNPPPASVFDRFARAPDDRASCDGRVTPEEVEAHGRRERGRADDADEDADLLDVSKLSLDQRTYVQLRAARLADASSLPSSVLVPPSVVDDDDCDDGCSRPDKDGGEDSPTLDEVVLRMRGDLASLHARCNAAAAVLQRAALTDAVQHAPLRKLREGEDRDVMAQYREMTKRQAIERRRVSGRHKTASRLGGEDWLPW